MTGAVAASFLVRFVAGLRFPFRTAGGGRPVRRIFRPTASATGRGGRGRSSYAERFSGAVRR